MVPWKGTIKFREDLFAPAGEISIEFTGKNPFLIMTNATKLLKEILKISGAKLREDDVRWDVSGDPRPFYGAWRAYRTEDRWTATEMKLWAQGSMGKDGNGSVKVRFRGFLWTRFKYGNPLTFALWSMFNYFFYGKQRRTYMDFSRDNLLEIRQRVLDGYGISRS